MNITRYRRNNDQDHEEPSDSEYKTSNEGSDIDDDDNVTYDKQRDSTTGNNVGFVVTLGHRSKMAEDDADSEIMRATRRESTATTRADTLQPRLDVFNEALARFETSDGRDRSRERGRIQRLAVQGRMNDQRPKRRLSQQRLLPATRNRLIKVVNHVLS